MGVQYFHFVPCLEDLAMWAVLAVKMAGCIGMVRYLVAQLTHNAIRGKTIGVAVCLVGSYDLIIKTKGFS
jgi:predicted membrane protein